LAAFSGFCAGLAIAKWRTEGLNGFDQFYIKPKPNSGPVAKTPSLDDHIEMMRRVGEGGPPLN